MTRQSQLISWTKRTPFDVWVCPRTSRAKFRINAREKIERSAFFALHAKFKYLVCIKSDPAIAWIDACLRLIPIKPRRVAITLIIRVVRKIVFAV